MDTELLKTFLEVEKNRHFGKAANNLYLTQSAVSARIRLLEEILGVTLFTRARHNLQLTAQGQRLIKHAQAMLQSWEEVRRDLAVRAEIPHPLLRIGGVFSLWDIVLRDWLHVLYREFPDLIVQAEVETPEILIRKLSDGVLDVAFLFEAPAALNLVCREIMEIPLILVSTQENTSVAQALEKHYLLVDWGMNFLAWHQEKFPSTSLPCGQINLGRVALDLILARGGGAYLAEPLCHAPLAGRQLFCVRGSPVFESKVYALYASYNPCLSLLEDTLAYFPRAR